MAVPPVNRSLDREYSLERGRTKGHTTRARGCADFLTFHFDEIPACELPTVTARCGEVDLQGLESQARNFLRIYGKELDFKHSENKYRDVVALNEAVKSVAPEVGTIELVERREEDCLHQEFVIYKQCEGFEVMTLFLLPVWIVSTVDAELRDVLMEFFTFLDYHAPFIQPKDSFDVAYNLGVLDRDDEEFDPEIECDWDEDYRTWAVRYTKGDINSVFEEIKKRRKPYAGRFEKLAESVRMKMAAYKAHGTMFYETPKGEVRAVSELFEVIEHGLKINMEDCLFNYELRHLRFVYRDEDFLIEEYPRYDIFDFDRQFMFCWGLSEDDPVVDKTVDSLNGDACNICETTLLNSVSLSECKGNVKFSDFPKRWFEWYRQIMHYIYE
jgi:hypothetical protein